MDDVLWIHINDRGLTRQMDELWVPQLRADVIWLSAADNSQVVSAYTERLIPIIEASPGEIAALAAEQHEEGRRALAVFRSLDALLEAADFGLPPQTVNFVALQSDPGTRIAPGVWLNQDDLEFARELHRLGFELIVQPLPNVTRRQLEMESLSFPQNGG
jgi:mannose/fructose/N-acetylgalactosamine-specific phosphotransferase system component IIB